MDSIEIKDRKFHFKVPTAWDGAAIFNFLTAYNMPFGAAAVFGLEATKKELPPEDLEKLMKLCLKYCYEELPGNNTPVVDEEGQIGIIGGESSPLLTKIFVQYMLFFTDWWREEDSLISSQDPPPME